MQGFLYSRTVKARVSGDSLRRVRLMPRRALAPLGQTEDVEKQAFWRGMLNTSTLASTWQSAIGIEGTSLDLSNCTRHWASGMISQEGLVIEVPP